MKLTAKQIKAIDEIERDRRAHSETLQVALNFHTNQLNEINRLHRELWEELAEIYAFDLYREGGWTTKIVDGAVTIVPATKTE